MRGVPFSYKSVRDDKGNPLRSGMILVDTARHQEGIWEYYLYLDRNTVFKLADTTPRTIDYLKDKGYIKIDKHDIRKIARLA